MAREMPKQYKSEIPATQSRGFRFHVRARSLDFESLNHSMHEVRFSVFCIIEKADKHVIARIEIRGFGSFVVKHRRAREGRNPKSGEIVSVAAKRVPFFKVGKELRLRVDGKPVPEGTE